MVLALTAALVVPYFVDWTGYRADFEREASRILGRDVEVRGSATARLLPFPSVTFTDVSVGGGEGEPSMTIDAFSMDAELAPFLSGEILIFDMRIVRPDIVVRLDESGTPDWAVRPTVPVGPGNVTLENVTVTDGRVRLVHEQSGREHLATDIDAVVSARTLAGPWRGEGTTVVDGVATRLSLSTGVPSADGAMRLRLVADPRDYPLAFETDGQVRMDPQQGLRYAGQFRFTASTRAPDPAVTPPPPPDYRLSGRFALEPDRLAAEEFVLETGPLSDPYTAEGRAVLHLGADPRFDIRAEGVQLRYDEASGGSATLQQRIDALARFVSALPRPKIPGRISVDLPAVVAGDTTIREVRVSAEPVDVGWRLASVAATLPGRSTLEASGTLAVDDGLDFEGSLLLAIRQPSGFASWLSRDVDDAIRRLPAAGFSAEVRLSQQEQSFRELELALGNSIFRGSAVNSAPAGRRPSLSLNLEGEGLDVPGISAFASLFVSDRGQNRLSGSDVDLEIAASDVSFGDLSAEKVDASLRLREGELEIDRLSLLDLAGTSIGAVGSLRGFPVAPTGTIEAAVMAADLAPLVRELAAIAPHSAVLRELAARADLDAAFLRDADISLTVTGEAGSSGGRGLAVAATGQAGGSSFELESALEALAPDLRTVPMRLSLRASAEEAASIYTMFGIPTIPLGLVGQGRAELTVAGTVAEGAELSLAVAGDDLEARLDGTLTLSEERRAVEGIASVRSPDLEPWLATAGVLLPGFGSGLPVELSASVDYQEGLVVVSELGGLVAEEEVSGDLNTELRDGVVHVTGALALDALDLGLVAETIVGAEAMPSGESGWPTGPFAQGSIVPFTAEIDVNTPALGFAGAFQVADVSTVLRLTADGMALDRFQGAAFGGRLSGNGELRNDGGTGLLSLQFTLEEGQVEQIVAGPSGRANISASLTSTGKSFGGLVAALSGSGSAALRDLLITGIDPDGLSALIERADAEGREISEAGVARMAEQTLRSGTMRPQPAEFAFSAAGGSVRAAPFALQAEGATMTIEPRADLYNGTVALQAGVVFEPGVYAQAGSQPELRLAVEGPLAEPTVTVDTQPLAQFLTQRALEREQQRVEAMQASLLEQQRLRRETRYYASVAEDWRQGLEAERERQRLEAERERQRLEAERERPSLEAEREPQSQEDEGVEAAPLPGPYRRLSQQEEQERVRRAQQISEQARRMAEEEAAGSDENFVEEVEQFLLFLDRVPTMDEDFDTGRP